MSPSRFVPALAALAIFPAAARAQDAVEAFYAGKTLRVVVGYPSGTVYDASSTTLAHSDRIIKLKG